MFVSRRRLSMSVQRRRPHHHYHDQPIWREFFYKSFIQ